MLHAVSRDAPGAFNVAAEGALPLSSLMALAAKLPVPVLHSFVYWGADWIRGVGRGAGRYMPIEPDYLRYPWVGDLACMCDELGFAPRYAAEQEAFRGEGESDE
ncbi:MAG: hypothetical protein JXA78_12650 [Anaerolineales bacterium]|nr:hypothetical protein [Anaerolineales bacterium]